MVLSRVGRNPISGKAAARKGKSGRIDGLAIGGTEMSVEKVIPFPQPDLSSNMNRRGVVPKGMVSAQARAFLDGLPMPALLLNGDLEVVGANARFHGDDPLGRRLGLNVIGQAYDGLWRNAGMSRRDCQFLKLNLHSLGVPRTPPFRLEQTLRDDGYERIVIYGSRIDQPDPYLLVVHFAVPSDRANITPEMQQMVLLQAEQEERRRIARELHDDTFQQLTLIQFGLETMKAADASPDIRDVCESIEAALSAVQHQVRTLSFVLHPPELDAGGLTKALESFISGFGRRSGLNVEFVNSAGDISVRPEVELAVYRVAQEALTNVLKHAAASRVKVRLKFKDGDLILEVEDNGIGIPKIMIEGRRREVRGVGLSGMRERIEALNGRLTIRSRSPGTLVSASIPSRRKADVCVR
jgi:signal transduction histidine kinase